MECDHKNEEYSCLYWKDAGGNNLMRGYPCQLQETKDELEAKGVKVKMKPF